MKKQFAESVNIFISLGIKIFPMAARLTPLKLSICRQQLCSNLPAKGVLAIHPKVSLTLQYYCGLACEFKKPCGWSTELFTLSVEF